jgi:hypothetical protein
MGCSSVNSVEEDIKLRQKNIFLNTNQIHHKKDLIHAQSLINLISRIRNKMIYLYHKLIYDTGACLYLNPTIAHCLKSVLYKVSCDLEGKFENAGMEYMEDPPYLKIPNKNEIKKETKDLLTELFNFIVEIKNYKTIIKQIDRETPGLLYLIFENKEYVSSENIDNINKGIELFKEMTNLRTSIINKYKLQVRDFLYRKEEFIRNINLIGKKAYELGMFDIYEINLLNRDIGQNGNSMFKSIKEAKKNMEKILKEEKNDEIINSNESIFEDFEDIL